MKTATPLSQAPLGTHEDNSGPWRFSEEWKVRCFEEVFERLNGNPHKIQTSEYGAYGLHPVIDQGQDIVVAFSDRTEKLFKCPTGGIIVFGDHTRIVKFVDVDFLIGADGTQLLAMQGNDAAKFFFYQLSTQEIPNTGYNRHFKFLKDLTFEIPPLDEQRAIAEVLSDVDRLIGALDALIAKKRAIKQATMQELLTGRTRLPGFSGEWETKRLGEMGHCLRGVSYDSTTDLASYDKDSTVRLLRANNIQDAAVVLNDVQYVEARKVSESQIMQSDDILVCMANGSKELVGKTGLFRVRNGHMYTFGAFMGCFRVEPTIAEPSFVFFLFHTHRFRNFFNLILSGSSINNLKPSDIEVAEFKVPDRNEQTAIVSVLSDMNAEITALEQRRDKTRAIKQGMMQQLLTGRVRLVKSDASP